MSRAGFDMVDSNNYIFTIYSLKILIILLFWGGGRGGGRGGGGTHCGRFKCQKKSFQCHKLVSTKKKGFQKKSKSPI